MENANVKLNNVDGFNPMEYVRTLEDGSLYLDVQWRKLWFRIVYPQGKIAVQIVHFDSNVAVIEAKVYADRNDEENNFLSCALAQRNLDATNDFGIRYLESAATAAVGRALTDAGFGLQFCTEKDTLPVEKGVSLPQPPMPQQPYNNGQQQQPQQQRTQQLQYNNNGYQQSQTQPQRQSQYNVDYQPQQPQPQRQPYNSYQQLPQEPQGAIPQNCFSPNMPVEKIKASMTYEKATKVKYIGSGKHGGQTVGQIASENINDVIWLAVKYNRNNIVTAAAQIICEHNGIQY